ncbi:MAG: hypothetical protein AVO33_08700 [delta proteobacterium ML8_F1]|nr:MAG: hypothetical protein AVO33_08700 [delta proteobacterium ML8_F1]
MFRRNALVIGSGAVDALSRKRVLVFGLGGVGGAAVEALARSGVGRLGIIDDDIFESSNRNRQLAALESTLGESKVRVTANRLRDINPQIELTLFEQKLTGDRIEEFFAEPVDYVVDAIDDIPGKVALASFCQRRGIPLIASLGTGNRLDPGCLEITDIYRTHTDPLARKFRKALKEAAVSSLEVVYSREKPVKLEGGHRGPGSLIFVPASAGILMAYQVVVRLIAVH